MAHPAPRIHTEGTELGFNRELFTPRILHTHFGRLDLVALREAMVGHAHHHAQMTFKIGGVDATFDVGGRRYLLTDHTAVLVNPWEEHATPMPGGGALLLSVYLDLAWLVSQLGPDFRHVAFNRSCVELSDRTRSVVDALADFLFHANDSTSADLESMVRALVSDLVLTDPSTPSSNVVRHAGRAPVWDFKIKRAVAYMEAHIQSGLNTSSIPAEACISRAHFFSRFKHCTSLTPHVFASLLRIEAVIERLLDANSTIEELSDELGFSAPSNFARFFRQRVGITPSEYRRNTTRLNAGTSASYAGLPFNSVPTNSRAFPSQITPRGSW